jgi:hypothetical protein
VIESVCTLLRWIDLKLARGQTLQQQQFDAPWVLHQEREREREQSSNLCDAFAYLSKDAGGIYD